MIILFGSRQYGKVDKVPGLGAVSTEFFHVQYFPLVPLGSYFVPESSGYQPVGIKVRLSLKSVLVAWCRAVAVVGIAASAVFAALEFGDDNQSNGVTALAFMAAFVCVYDLLRVTRGIGRATEAKEASLRERFDLPDRADFAVPDTRAA